MTSPSPIAPTKAVQIVHLVLAILAAVVIATASVGLFGSHAECELGPSCQATGAAGDAV